MADFSHEYGCYKPMQPSRVLRPEMLVKDVIRTFEEEFINPFNVISGSTKAFVLSSGVPVADDVAISIITHLNSYN